MLIEIAVRLAALFWLQDPNLAWLDQLRNVDSTARELTRTVVTAAQSHRAAVRRVQFSFEYDVNQIVGVDKTSSGHYEGVVYWTPGAWRADIRNPSAEGTKAKQTLIRTPDYVAEIQWTEHSGPMLTVKHPKPEEEWLTSGGFSMLDPGRHYAEIPLRFARPGLSQASEVHIAQEADFQVLVGTVTSANMRSRFEWLFDEAKEFLPIGARVHNERDGEFIKEKEWRFEWENFGDVWYIRHIVIDTLMGDPAKTRKWVRTDDLRFSDIKLNASAQFANSVFDYGTVDIPDGAHGVDYRSSKPKMLVVSGGRARELSPGERSRLPATIIEEIERHRATKPAPLSGVGRQVLWFRILCGVAGCIGLVITAVVIRRWFWRTKRS